jgi:hypothetical protein
MTEAVSHHSVSEKARVRSQCSPCGICGEHNDTGKGFSLNASVSSISIIPLMIYTQLNLKVALNQNYKKTNLGT